MRLWQCFSHCPSLGWWPQCLVLRIEYTMIPLERISWSKSSVGEIVCRERHCGEWPNLKRIMLIATPRACDCQHTWSSRYLASVICKVRLNSWNTKYSKNVTYVCKNIISVEHVLLECPITVDLLKKNGYDLNDCNNVRDILYNNDIIIYIVK